MSKYRTSQDHDQHLKLELAPEGIAREAGVSRSAVSRTFTQGASVSDKMRRKVMKAAIDKHMIRPTNSCEHMALYQGMREGV